jgi:hypothetical protein
MCALEAITWFAGDTTYFYPANPEIPSHSVPTSPLHVRSPFLFDTAAFPDICANEFV